MGPVTEMDSPSMTPTESEAGSSGCAAAAEKNAAQSNAMQAAGTAVERRNAFELEKSVTKDARNHIGGKSRLYYTSAAWQAHVGTTVPHRI
jgi:hypothetical protein